MKNLEEIYSKMLGNPTPGDLADLEKKYEELGAAISDKQVSEKVDISTIQKHGELHNAYLYLKTRWTINRHKNSDLIIDGLNLAKKESLGTTPLNNIKQKDILHKIHNRLQSMTKVGIVTIFGISIYQTTKSFILDGSVFASADKSALEQAIIEINTQKAKRSAIKPKADGDTFEAIYDRAPKFDNGPELIKAAKNCSFEELKIALSNNPNINTKGSSGENVTHWLSRRNCPDELEWTLKKGADPYIRDNSGRNANDWAKLSNSFESIQVLNRHANGQL